jgi:hypothetical protein
LSFFGNLREPIRSANGSGRSSDGATTLKIAVVALMRWRS